MSQGKHLPSILVPHHKNTSNLETVVMPVPDVVKICMSQSIGAPCKPLVAKGDHVKVGQRIGDTDAFVSAPVHSSVSGTVTDIVQSRGGMGGMETLIVIETDKKQEVSEEVQIPHVTNHAEFVKAVRDSGVVGLGGASFPTHIKLNPKNLDECDVLVVNAAECEPYITGDNRMMVEQGQDVLDGMKLIMKYLDLKKGIIGIEENKPEAIENMNNLIQQNGFDDIEVLALQSRYPKGAERVLVYEATGKVMDAGVLPAQLGVILDNVSTVAIILQDRNANRSQKNYRRRGCGSRAEERIRSNRYSDCGCNGILRRIQERAEEDRNGRTDDGSCDQLGRERYHEEYRFPAGIR